MKLVLDEKALTDLNAFFQELPFKYAAPLVNFINEQIKKQESEKIAEDSANKAEVTEK